MNNSNTMFKILLISFSLILITFSACKKNEVNNNADAEGYRTITQASDTREYIVHVPTSYDANTATPLVINYHGFGGNAANFMTEVGAFNTVANNNNFIVAYPQGVERTKGGAEWDPGDNGNQSIQDNDVYFTKQLIANISQEFNIDPNKIYATGYSNGGMMAYGLACAQADQIAAVGIMSGTMLQGTCNTNNYTSVIHFHGADDDVLPYNGNQDFEAIPDVVNFWLNHNNIPAASLVSAQLDAGDVQKDVYTGGNDNTDYHLYKMNKGRHVWFNETIDGKNSNQILWEFLSAYSLLD